MVDELKETKETFAEDLDTSDMTRKILEIEKKVDGNIPQQEWVAPTLLNSWVNFGGDYEIAGYMVDSLGFVHLKGVVKSVAQGTEKLYEYNEDRLKKAYLTRER